MTQTATARTAWMSFPVPDPWHIDAEAAGADLTVRRPASDAGGPAAVTATAVASTAGVTDAAAARVRAVLDGNVGAYVVSCEACTAGGRPACRILFTHPVGAERDGAVDEILWATGGRVLRLSAQCAVAGLPAVSAGLDAMAADAVFADAVFADAVDAAASGVGSHPAAQEPAGPNAGADPLAFVAPRQRFAADGPVLPASAVRLLARTRRRLDRGRRDAADAAVLYDLGLVDAAGVLTKAGSNIRSHWRRSKPLLEIRTRGARSGMLTAWLGTHDTVLIGTTPTDGAGPLSGKDEDGMRLGVFTLDRALPAVLSWLGVRPTSSAGAAAAIPVADYGARLGGAPTPAPADADDALRRAWQAPWTEHRLQSPQAGLVIVDAASAGFVQAAAQGDTVHMRVVSSRAVFDAVIGIYGGAVADVA